MTKAEIQKKFLPLTVVCIIITLISVLFKTWLTERGVDTRVILGGNLLIFVLALISYSLAVRTLENPNPNAFVRGVFSGILLKLFVCMIAAFVYIASTKKNVNKIGLFTVMGLYLVYTFMEVGALTGLLRKKKNG